ncbi:hypothetical protein LRP88_05446 [Fusarium phalaenopsidis]
MASNYVTDRPSTEVVTLESRNQFFDEAFLTVAVDEYDAEIKWLWKDECGQAASKGCVKFHHNLSMKDWKIRCITNFDLQERQLIETFNHDKLIALARRRIAKWAKSDSSLDLPDRNIDHLKLREPGLIRPKIRESTTDITEVANEVVRVALAKQAQQPYPGATHEITLPEFPKKKKLSESSVEAGAWIQDLFGEAKQDEPGQSPTKKRKRQVEDNQESSKKIRQDRKDAHRSSSKAFLSVVNEKSGEPRWQWKDIYGWAASNDLVNFHEGLTLEDWKILCLKNYDYYEQRLTDHYYRGAENCGPPDSSMP